MNKIAAVFFAGFLISAPAMAADLTINIEQIPKDAVPRPISGSSMADSIMSQIAKCWIPPVGVKGAGNLAVLVDAHYNPDGTLTGPPSLPYAEIARYNSDNDYRAAADSAVHAVQNCSPLRGLPADQYGVPQGWRYLELNFDPKFMLQ